MSKYNIHVDMFISIYKIGFFKYLTCYNFGFHDVKNICTGRKALNNIGVINVQ